MDDEGSLETAYSELRVKLSAYASAFRLPREDAEDALHDSFLRMNSESLDPAETRARLTVALRNNLIDRFRRKNKFRMESLDVIDGTIGYYAGETDESYARSDILRQIKGLLSGLQYEILCLRACDGLEYSEIARKLKMTETAVRTNICRARKTIKDILRK